MALTGEKLMSVLVENLSIEELEALIEKKKNASKPKRVSREDYMINKITNQLLSMGIFYPPK